MKKKNTLIKVLAAASVAILLFGFRPGTGKPILTMRTAEFMNGMYDNSIIIVDENGKMETIELKRLKIGNVSSNMVTINQTLNSLTGKGYHLVSSAGSGSEGAIVTTYTFEKE